MNTEDEMRETDGEIAHQVVLVLVDSVMKSQRNLINCLKGEVPYPRGTISSLEFANRALHEYRRRT